MSRKTIQSEMGRLSKLKMPKEKVVDDFEAVQTTSPPNQAGAPQRSRSRRSQVGPDGSQPTAYRELR